VKGNDNILEKAMVEKESYMKHISQSRGDINYSQIDLFNSKPLFTEHFLYGTNLAGAQAQDITNGDGEQWFSMCRLFLGSIDKKVAKSPNREQRYN
jgi:hypothetical protein